MPATVITKEPIPSDEDEQRIAADIQLRIKAGAIRSWVDRSDGSRTLCTEWNIIGEQ